MPEAFQDRLTDLGSSEVPDVPDGLLRSGETEAAQLRLAHRDSRRRQILCGFAVALALVAASFTPPGRAAAEWLGGLAGVGESPTSEQRLVVEGSPAVLKSGQLPDGTGYEIVAKHVTDETLEPAFSQGLPRMDLLCFQVDWPAQGVGGQGGACTRTGGVAQYEIETSGLYFPPESPGGVGRRDEPEPRESGPAIYMGIVEHVGVDEVAVTYDPGDSENQTLPVEMLSVPDSVLDGAEVPLKRLFVSIVPAEIVAGSRNEAPGQLTATAYSEGEAVYSITAFNDCPDAAAARAPDAGGEEVKPTRAPNPVAPPLAANGSRAVCGPPALQEDFAEPGGPSEGAAPSSETGGVD